MGASRRDEETLKKGKEEKQLQGLANPGLLGCPGELFSQWVEAAIGTS